jgi:hypothetical protein
MVPREIRGPRRFEGPPGLCAELDYLAPRFRTAVRAAANTYRRLGVRYALIGGLAAGAYGRPRSTKDADFLVGEEAFDSLGIVISFKPGIPQEACEVPIDNIPPHVDYADLYERALNEAVESDEPGVLIAGAEMVAVTKLVGGRSHDVAAVVEMMRAGTVDIDELERLVRPHGKLRLVFARAQREYEDGNE